MIVRNDESRMMTVSEVSEILHVHPNTLRRWSDEGKIVSYCITSRGDRRYLKKDVEDFLSQFKAYKDTNTNPPTED
jgi:excisionase family DNA binding protein